MRDASGEPESCAAPAGLLPDYAGGSLLNLMQSIALASGVSACAHAPLRGLDVGRLKAATHLVLILADGLGLHTLTGAGRGSALHGHLHGWASSVFPSTTAAAITTVMTGLAPQQHALTGWHMYFREIDRVLASLPLSPRDGGTIAPELLPLAPRLFAHRSLYGSLDRRSWVISPARIDDAPFNRHHSQGASRIAYGDLEGMFEAIECLLAGSGERRFIYAYFPDLDEAAHEHGIASEEVSGCLAAFDRRFARFADSIRGSDTAVIVTADHGFIDAPPRRRIELDDHPRLAAMLRRPLCGERRIAYCYVREACHEQFERYVCGELGHACAVRRSRDLIRAGWFGPGEENPELASRIGDYTLVMKEDWTILDRLPGEKRHRMVGVHGGISAQEMRVPVITL
ncbi:MAG: alkaline phosphatase family protein [Rhodocyclaceae bacterium]